jgi:hypothetical protein
MTNKIIYELKIKLMLLSTHAFLNYSCVPSHSHNSCNNSEKKKIFIFPDNYVKECSLREAIQNEQLHEQIARYGETSTEILQIFNLISKN